MKKTNKISPSKKYKIQYETNSGIDLTIPNDSYKIRDLLVKFSNGVQPAQYSVGKPVYLNEPIDGIDYGKVSEMDFAEQHKFLGSTRKRVQRLQEEHDRLHQQLEKAKTDLNQTKNDDE